MRNGSIMKSHGMQGKSGREEVNEKREKKNENNVILSIDSKRRKEIAAGPVGHPKALFGPELLCKIRAEITRDLRLRNHYRAFQFQSCFP